MKKYKLDLRPYKVKVRLPVIEENGENKIPSFNDVEQNYPLRENINAWLRSVGIFKTPEDIVEAVDLAKQILACEHDFIVLDEREADILKRALTRMIELTSEGKTNVGGQVHEEAIYRVVKMEEVN